MMFELNENLKIEKELFEGTVIYTIDDFYKNPKEVENYLFGQPNKISLHKMDEKPSFNNVYFEDRRHDDSIDNLDLKKVYDFLSRLCGQGYETPDVVTNCTRFKRHQFNDYKNYYWWPHTDGGYNGIVYFNDDSEHGTCFYEELVEKPDVPEHYQPWGAKKDFIVIKTLEPKYNRFVFFDGYEFPHGMNICTDRYFGEEYRKNQVFFFDNPEFLKELEEEDD
tara:strand:+ start:28 stop:693 length:666 start_codon:yes stop_codon:yes gene_type:complete